MKTPWFLGYPERTLPDTRRRPTQLRGGRRPRRLALHAHESPGANMDERRSGVG